MGNKVVVKCRTDRLLVSGLEVTEGYDFFFKRKLSKRCWGHWAWCEGRSGWRVET